MGPSQKLANYASSLEMQDLPSEVVEHVKLCILDAIGCALFGATLPWGKIVTEYIESAGGRRQSQVWGSNIRAPANAAALVNGTLIHSFELDDLHKHSIVHPTGVALPAVLALADQKGGVPGADIIVAYVAGAEVGIRVGKSVATAQLTRGFHPTGTVGPVIAAGAAGRLLGLDPEEMLDALGIGATQGAGLMAAQFESMAKRFHAGRAAQSGVYAAELAARGFKGIKAPFENDYGGFCVAYGGPNADVGNITEGLGETFETLMTGFKCYASCGSTHTSIAAAQELRERYGIRPDDVEAIDVEATTATYLHVGWLYAPGSVTRAQMNLTYATAVGLTYGEAFVDQYSETMIADPALLRLANLVKVWPSSELDALGPAGRHNVRFTVTCKDGRVLKIERSHGKGSAADPLSREEVVSKFHRLAGARIGSASDRLFSTIMTLEQRSSEDLRKLLALAKPTAGGTLVGTRHAAIGR